MPHGVCIDTELGPLDAELEVQVTGQLIAEIEAGASWCLRRGREPLVIDQKKARDAPVPTDDLWMGEGSA